MRELTYWQALRAALSDAMRRDPSVFLLGEDIGAYGGAFGVTRGMLDEFGPDRVRCTPISEGSVVGMATGAALTGMRPVVEIMFMDFLTLAMDQLANHAAKFRYMYGPQACVPLVIRTPAGGGRCYGATHSQSLEAWLLHIPGIKVITPATPADALGLLAAAIADLNPVVCVEHKLLYATTGMVDENAPPLPIGRGIVRRPGADVTLVAYSYYVGIALQAADVLEGDGIDAEVIDLRSLVPMDTDLVLDSVRKTGRLVCIEEGTRTGGVGAEIAARVAEHAYEYLDGPIRRIAASDTPIPFSPALEPRALPGLDDIVQTVRGLVSGRSTAEAC